MSAQNFLVSPGPAITLDSGAPAGAGETVKLDPDNAHNARLIKAGRLVELKAKPKTRPKAKETD